MLTRMARMARMLTHMLTRMTRWLAYYTHSHFRVRYTIMCYRGNSDSNLLSLKVVFRYFIKGPASFLC